jgi:hypothetical protein
MRQLLLHSLTVLACLGVFGLPQTSAAPHKPNLSGVWTLDLKQSTSLEPMMREIGASLIERKYAASTRLKATIHQTENVMTVATRGPAFILDERLYLDGRTESGGLKLLGATSLRSRTTWSKDNKLIATHQIRTKQGKEGELIITRYPISEGKSLVVAFTLKLSGEPHTTARQIWHRQA